MSTRDAYVEKYKAKIDEWNAEVSRLEAKVRVADADARVQYQQEVEKLNAQLEKGRETLKSIQSANEAAFDDLRKGAESMWSTFEESMKSAWSRYK